jgi:putative chitinase
MLQLNELKGHVPDGVIDQIPDVLDMFGINTPLRLAHFLAQCATESGEFKLVRENLNYSADRLQVVFPKYFPGTIANTYARKPDKIGSRVYANRMGNGPEVSKDGFTYRGRGYIQLTGKNNYIAFGKAINTDLIKNPDLVATQYPLLSAAWFFSKNKLNEVADKGATDKVVTSVSKIVNGGTNGLTERINHFHKYYALLS